VFVRSLCFSPSQSSLGDSLLYLLKFFISIYGLLLFYVSSEIVVQCGARVLCSCGGLVAELQAVPGLWAVLHVHHGAGVTVLVLCVFSLGT